MAYVKLLRSGLLAVLGLALFAPMASAHSTALCKTNELPCSAGNTVASGTEISAELTTGTTLQLLNNLGNVICKKVALTGKTTSGLATTVTLSVTDLTFSEKCKLGAQTCQTSEALDSPYASTLLYIPGTMDGTLKVEDLKLKFSCGFLLSCAFLYEPLTTSLQGGNPAKITAKEVLTSSTAGVLCPGESHLDAEFQITSPQPLYVSE